MAASSGAAGADEANGIRSKSSAMPDPTSPNVPYLHARVHQRLTPAICAQLPMSALTFRPLEARDFSEMVALHREWFPVAYDEAFYNKSVKGEIFTMAATHISRNGAGEEEEDILGIVTFSTSSEHHSREDIISVLGTDCANACERRRREEESLNGGESGVSTGCVAYILTLGVIDGFRRRGLASRLLENSIAHVSRQMPHVQAVYLHVVTYNEAAIRLYEANRFVCLARFPNFYNLHGSPYDSFLYATYINGGRPPWKWRFKNFMASASSWREWIICAWSSLWRADSSGRLRSDRSGLCP
eukprot:gnl/TRDRNA2_/TRDRNA2_201427_c0_seq1.p1 gnl/TRDRNA2_/TRDRNA2_201427_c0~~gnl/TRDRNA2_/TRDRNA2_201427_c0_seq1.p1  ORF type:complete len:319 (-),score=18.60 gnl/TRDRNA2_/TRDRNA2_201427_c0_seq1:43-945(-)